MGPSFRHTTHGKNCKLHGRKTCPWCDPYRPPAPVRQLSPEEVAQLAKSIRPPLAKQKPKAPTW